jgi:hypothetical protein
MNPLLIDFETYNGTVEASNWGTPFGGATAGTGTVYAGPYAYGDETVTPTLAILAGRPPSMYAVAETVTQTRGWGMGGGIWMGCVDATGYKGVSFWVRGMSERAVFSFSIDMESTVRPDENNNAGGGTCPGTKDTCQAATKVDIPLTMDWTQVQLLWADFTPGMSAGTPVTVDGNNITGLGWSVPLPFILDPTVPADAAGPYVPVPGDLRINIDDISFIQ